VGDTAARACTDTAGMHIATETTLALAAVVVWVVVLPFQLVSG
jgi:hypothetical protein